MSERKQIAVYVPDQATFETVTGMLDAAAKELHFPSRAAMLVSLFTQSKEAFVAAMQPLAAAYHAQGRPKRPYRRKVTKTENS